MSIKFHLPDFARLSKFNMVFLAMYENSREFFREGVEIGSFYGVFPPSVWNGGRVMFGNCDKKFVKNIIKYFNDKKIPLRFTFTNPMLEEKHLDDAFCNMVMNYADNGMNGCIVASDMLEEYIRKNYPSFKITSSTCKRITGEDSLAKELQKDYSLVVLDYDFNNRFDVLEKIENKEKCELLVNPCCVPGCRNRSDHYRVIGLEQIAIAEHIKKNPANVPYDPDKFARQHKEYKAELECKCELRSLYEIQDLPTHISPDDIWEKYVPMGFCNFKIEGRTFDIFNLMEHYLYYMVKPECINQARLVFLRNLRRNGVINVVE
ncbi:MAG: hypothetical protein PUE12_09120 [Oscillospiraceae bacterium]|nr:hypothetical protein [Oscillospiraceae bacterium]